MANIVGKGYTIPDDIKFEKTAVYSSRCFVLIVNT